MTTMSEIETQRSLVRLACLDEREAVVDWLRSATHGIDSQRRDGESIAECIARLIEEGAHRR